MPVGMMLVVGVLMGMSFRSVGVRMGMRFLRIRWLQTRGMHVLVLRVLMGMRVRMDLFVVGMRMGVRGHT
jgi:putative Mn2+ efflux pump MntP